MEPWEMTSDAFVGPWHVGSQFAIDGRTDEDYEWIWECASDEACLRPAARTTAAGYAVREIADVEPPGTFALLAPDGTPCGFYMDAQLWIDPPHRGRGLSAELVLAAAAVLGGSPTRNELGIGFSEAGLKAHLAAHARAVREAHEAGLPVPEAVLDEYGLAPAAPRP